MKKYVLFVLLITMMILTSCYKCDLQETPYTYFSQIENVCTSTVGNDALSIMYLANGNTAMYVVYQERCIASEDQTFYYKKNIDSCGIERVSPISKEEFDAR